jgi:TIR domain
MTSEWLTMLGKLVEYDVFVSYPRVEREFAIWLEQRLIGRGYTVFWDNQLVPGRVFLSALEKAIESSIAGIVVETTDSRKSEWVEREVYLLLLRGPFHVFPLIPLLLEGDGIRPSLAEHQLHYVDFRGIGWRGDSVSHDCETALSQLFRGLSFARHAAPRSVGRSGDLPTSPFGLRLLGLLTLLLLLAITLAATYLSDARFNERKAFLLNRSATIANIDRGLASAYTFDVPVGLVLSQGRPIDVESTTIPQRDIANRIVALDEWRDGYLRRRQFLEDGAIIGSDEYSYAGRKLVARLRQFSLMDGAMVEEGWLPDGTLAGRYVVSGESRHLLVDQNPATRIPVTSAAWMVPWYR